MGPTTKGGVGSVANKQKKHGLFLGPTSNELHWREALENTAKACHKNIETIPKYAWTTYKDMAECPTLDVLHWFEKI